MLLTVVAYFGPKLFLWIALPRNLVVICLTKLGHTVMVTSDELYQNINDMTTSSQIFLVGAVFRTHCSKMWKALKNILL